MALLTPSDWDAFLAGHPEAHLLQTAAWGELKAAFGWQVVHLASADRSAGAQLLFRKLPFRYNIAYIPRGPVGELACLLPEIDDICRKLKMVFLKVEPDSWEHENQENQDVRGFTVSHHAIQPRRTLVVDLIGSEEDVLDRMKQKTRYNIRLAQKKGVVVHPSADIDLFHRLMIKTGKRDGFGVHSAEYYHKVYSLFHSKGECELLIAEFDGEPLGGLMVFAHGTRSWYLYGASASDHRDRMPTYLLQWEAMRWARAHGCTEYDLWGVPDEDEQTLEDQFTNRSSGLWGVYRFKRGFGGCLLRASPPLDRIYNPLLYRVYSLWASRGDGG